MSRPPNSRSVRPAHASPAGAAPEEHATGYLRTSVIIDEDIDRWLMELGVSCKVAGGKKLRKTTIIRAAIRALMDLELDLNRVRDEDDLKDRIVTSIRRLSRKK